MKNNFAMSATMRAPSVLSTDALFSSARSYKTDRGSHIIEGLRVFKAGTFADSMGIVRTWEESHLEQMVFHFRLLRDGGVFPNVPIRVDHSYSAHDVVGYFVDIYRDSDDPMFLAGDVEITEPDAFEKWERGTFRSRSIEVGMYETNDEASYWPVVMGLAFVDIPAVEGLHGKNRQRPPEGGSGGAQFNFSQTLKDNDHKENTVDEQEFLAACAYAQWVQAAEYAQACADWEGAVTYAAALEAHEAEAQALGLSTPPASNHGRVAAFRISGTEVADHAAIQGHIDALETFQRETIESGRREFVNGLANSGRIAATQLDSMHGLVATMNDTQFAAFKASYEAAPTNTLFASHGAPGAPADPPASGVEGPSEMETLEEIVANHRRTGKSDEQIQELDSYKKLQSLKSQGK